MTRPETRPAGAWALATAVVTLAPHALYLPLWISACCGLLLAWQARRLYAGTPPAGRLLRFGLLVVATAIALGLRQHFGYFFGKDPGVALLAALLCVKLLEGGSTRDVRAAILLALFLQLGLFFEDQSLPVAALALCGTLCACATLLTLEDPNARPTQALRTAGVLMLQAVPFLLVLFVLFPRIPGPLWGLPADAHSGVTGLSEQMQPGSISQLMESDEIALRAEFAGNPPPPAQRYWRGPVLTDFDGRAWRARSSPLQATPPYSTSGMRYDYVATIEPHRRRWLLALDYPGTTGQPGTRHAGDLQLLADRPLAQRTRVALSAFPETPVGTDESPVVLERARQLPPQSSPRTRAAMARLMDGTSDPEVKLERALMFLRERQLTYTLSPPLLGDQPVDEFLFDTRRGFCEHFSSAFAVMMRAVGIPARVVTGYQGGTVNRFDGTLVVRQSDAHAWVEVWLAERGWVRVDPTALAVPDRIELGLSGALPAGEARPFMLRSGFAADMLRGMRDRWEAVSSAWNSNIIGFDQQRQRSLLERLGLDRVDLRALGLLLVGCILVLTMILVGWMMRRRPAGDALDLAWQRFCRKLARAGVARLPSEGPLDYAERVARALPEHATRARCIASRYARLRYGPGGPDVAAQTRELARNIRTFRPY